MGYVSGGGGSRSTSGVSLLTKLPLIRLRMSSWPRLHSMCAIRMPRHAGSASRQSLMVRPAAMHGDSSRHARTISRSFLQLLAICFSGPEPGETSDGNCNDGELRLAPIYYRFRRRLFLSAKPIPKGIQPPRLARSYFGRLCGALCRPRSAAARWSGLRSARRWSRPAAASPRRARAGGRTASPFSSETRGATTGSSSGCFRRRR